MKTSRFVLAAVVLAVASAGASAADLVTNGDFETYGGGTVTNSYSAVGAGSLLLSGWTVGGSIDVINGAYGALDGNSIDMQGSPGPGSLWQTLATTAGQNYHLTFDLGANGSNSIADNSINLSFNDAVVGTYVGSNSRTHVTYDFTAASNSTVLKFATITGASGGAVLDNVAVAAVPEPESYAMLLAGLGLMGFVAKRRKAKQA